MINLATAHLFADYKIWANQRLFDSLEALPPEEITQERKTIFKTMLGTLNHIYVVDRIWQAHLEGRDHGFQSSHDLVHADLGELRQAQQQVDSWYCTWSQQQTEASLNREIDFKFVSGDGGSMSAGAIFLHVINHNSYHRGWVIQMYFEIPQMPPMTDLPVYLREVDPNFKAFTAPPAAAEPTCDGQSASATNVPQGRCR
ncbi:DinB family protein [Pseudomonas sp. FP2196]|uniref:DinB family protein n=1 Tax=Pseudomonas sp. FP2196 TaxID=2954086 RepID=UPI0027364F1A|nr:DinB family protein [Pseudomonas sp. FP2196]WLH38439.1 DinB family protein [Pseudomonas sp. FP2196]